MSDLQIPALAIATGVGGVVVAIIAVGKDYIYSI